MTLLRMFLSDTVVEFGNKSLIEKLFFLKETYEMFAFFTEIKTRLAALEAKVEGLFKDKEVEVKAEVTKVEDQAVVAATPAAVVAAVEEVKPAE